MDFTVQAKDTDIDYANTGNTPVGSASVVSEICHSCLRARGVRYNDDGAGAGAHAADTSGSRPRSSSSSTASITRCLESRRRRPLRNPVRARRRRKQLEKRTARFLHLSHAVNSVVDDTRARTARRRADRKADGRTPEPAGARIEVSRLVDSRIRIHRRDDELGSFPKLLSDLHGEHCRHIARTVRSNTWSIHIRWRNSWNSWNSFELRSHLPKLEPQKKSLQILGITMAVTYLIMIRFDSMPLLFACAVLNGLG